MSLASRTRERGAIPVFQNGSFSQRLWGWGGMATRLAIRVLCLSILSAVAASAQDGAALFKSYCATCHEAGNNSDSRAPGRDVLAQLTPGQILQALEKGDMKT